MIIKKRKSILTYFISTSAVLLLIVLVFNSLTLQKQYRSYSQAVQASKVLQICNALFQSVRHYGFERGRVNVVLNFQGSPEKTNKSKEFLRQHRQKGDQALQQALHDLRSLPFYSKLTVIQDIQSTQEKIEGLRRLYEEEFPLKIEARDKNLDDLWFETMSEQIGAINFLLFSIIQKTEWLPQQRYLADSFYFLSRLRDNAGPVASYLKAASFNSASLTKKRVHELQKRKEPTEEYTNKLIFLTEERIGDETSALVVNFKKSYFDGFYPHADRFIEQSMQKHEKAVLAENFLPLGVKALEKLNLVRQSIEQTYLDINTKIISQQTTNLTIGITASIATFLIIFFSLYLMYNLIYRRIISSHKVMDRLIHGDLDIEICAPTAQDEIGAIEKGLVKFKENLIELNRTNNNLSTEIKQRIDSEKKLFNLSEERGFLLKEIHHRVKNNLQIITSMISLQKRAETDEGVINSLSECQRRIDNIATTHQFIYQAGNLSSINSKEFFEKIITQTIEAFNGSTEKIATEIEITDVTINFDKAITCAQILGELIANSYKHAFQAETAGKVTVLLCREPNNQMKMIVSDNGCGFNLGEAQSKSLGIRLVYALTQKLEGQLSFSFSAGTTATLQFKE